ncbi:hypothetical protein IRZ71_05115 [Flavobacterium sp. ANB]|uniref:hypothetical protein n=1 Tax=unclassified Flavobacterium TaxID=196869 RepID=UPI0012B8428D|nr:MULTISPECIES: hypothetical protein [unclassified Flavobacterium]MBF4515708.1 hypothetical protein [Flavobacterium sp. ANB]MTD68711.1 hypothetical protein [Flavobacterium sp. LC2016-13]
MRLILSSIFFFLFISISSAQDDDIVQLKNVSDTILNTKRTLLIKGPLDPVKTMLKLFPGKLYNMPDHNTFMSWKCKTCKPVAYVDANGEEGDQLFPYTEGVATRLLTTIDYSDSKANQFKFLVFNHSVYDADGLQTSRFTGGLLSIAKFVKNENAWEMKSFQPAIQAFGSFAKSPVPKLVQIGEDQYALTLVHANGGGGAPYSGYLYLLVGFDGKYQPLMEVDYYSLFNSVSSEWSSSYTVVNDNNKKFFRDFVITTTGSYKKAKGTEDDYEVDLPSEIAQMGKTKKQFNFVIERRFSFKGKRYNIVGKPVVKFSNIK